MSGSGADAARDAPDRAGAVRRFAYHRSIAPLMWVFVAIATVELIVVHLLVALWWPAVAVILSLLGLASILWLIAFIASFRTRPVLLGEGRLVMRIGGLKTLSVPLSDIAGLRETWSAAALRERDVLNLALIAYPNVVVALRTPVRSGGRSIGAIAHRLDDPAAFVAAIGALGRRDG